jgi:hypothetical protein
MTSFVVQVSGTLPPHELDHAHRLRRHTVLAATVQDMSALYGLLKKLSDLGLDLLALRPLARPTEREAPDLPDSAGRIEVEVIIRGSIGELAMSALGDHIEVTHVATRLVLPDHLLVDRVLDWARAASASVEYVAEDSPATIAFRC